MPPFTMMTSQALLIGETLLFIAATIHSFRQRNIRRTPAIGHQIEYANERRKSGGGGPVSAAWLQHGRFVFYFLFFFSRKMSDLFGQRWLMAIQIDGGHYGHSPTTKRGERQQERPIGHCRRNGLRWQLDVDGRPESGQTGNRN